MKPKYSRWLISSQPQPPAPYLVSNRPLTTPLTLFFFVRRHLEACRGDRSREIRSLAAQSSTRDCGNGFDSIGRKSETSNLVVENTHGTSGYETVTGWLKTCRVQVHRKPVTRWLKIHRVQVHVKLVTRCLEKKKGGRGTGNHAVTRWLKIHSIQVHIKPVTGQLKIHSIQVHVKLVT